MNGNDIKSMVFSAGADICGIAPVERFSSAPAGFHPQDIYSDTKSVIVFARRFPHGTVLTENPLPYSISDDIVTDQIRLITYNVSLLLEDKGINAVPVYTEPYSYWDKDTLTGKGDLSLKHAGYLAGLGVFGKNHLLYHYRYGNMIKLGAVLVNIALQPDDIQQFTFCRESCLLCLKSCPSGALEDNTVVQQKCRNQSEGLSNKGYPVTKCTVCRTKCPYSFGIERPGNT